MPRKNNIFVQELLQQLIENNIATSILKEMESLIENIKWGKIRKFTKCNSIVSTIASYSKKITSQSFLHFVKKGFKQINYSNRLILLLYKKDNNMIAFNNNTTTNHNILVQVAKAFFQGLAAPKQVNDSRIAKASLSNSQGVLPENLKRNLREFGYRFNYQNNTLVKQDSTKGEFDKQIRDQTNKLSGNHKRPTKVNRFHYVLDSVINFRRQRVFLTSYSNSNGEENCTISETTRRLFFSKKSNFKKFLDILTQAENRAASLLQKQAINFILIKSRFRFAFYYFDYIVGRSHIS